MSCRRKDEQRHKWCELSAAPLQMAPYYIQVTFTSLLTLFHHHLPACPRLPTTNHNCSVQFFEEIIQVYFATFDLFTSCSTICSNRHSTLQDNANSTCLARASLRHNTIRAWPSCFGHSSLPTKYRGNSPERGIDKTQSKPTEV